MRRILPAAFALAVAVTGLPSATASLLVTEPFDYPAQTYPAGTWSASALGGSGIGWGANTYFDHTTSACNFVIGDGVATGTYFESAGQNNSGSYWRNRVMSPAIGDSADGTVIWQSMLVWSDGSNSGGGMIVHDSNGGTNYNIRLASGNVYELRGGHDSPVSTVSTITASTDSASPDLLVFKIENTVGTGNQTASLWVNPISPTEAGLPAPALSVSYVAFINNRNIGGINLTPGGIKMDEIVFASDYADFGIVEPPGPPSEPSNPVPADAAVNVVTSTNLDWGDSIRTTSYQVFLWQDGLLEPGTPVATPTASAYDPPSSLSFATIYHWRVKAMGPEGSTVGPLWTFTTESNLPPDPVTNPFPANGAGDISLDTSLGWDASARATSYAVYLWKSSGSKPASPTVTTTSPALTPASDLEAATTYYWQVTGVNGAGPAAGPLWSFSTGAVPAAPSAPAPEDDATDKPCFLVLDWADATGAGSYQVFIWADGDSEPASPSATTTASLLKPVTVLDPSTLYHWRVKAVNSIGLASGPVWSFTTSSTPSTILATEPFDYPAGTYAAGSWSASKFLQGSGVGWGFNAYFDHTSSACNFVIGSGAPTDTYFEGADQNNYGSYWRNRVMSPAIGNNTNGTVIWQSMLVWSDGSNNGGGMVVHDSNGGTNYNIRLASGNVYELRGGHNNTQGTTDQVVSALTASTDIDHPDLLLFKIENTSGSGMQTVGLWVNPDVTTGEAALPAPDLRVSYRAYTDNRNLGGINLSPGAIKLDEIFFGETFMDVVSGIPPVPPYAPTPSAGATDVSVTKTLRWSNADADSYQVFFWPSSLTKPTTPTATVTDLLYDPPGNLALNTAYSWQVVVVKGGAEAAGPVWTFRTGDPLPPGPPSVPMPTTGAMEVATSPTLSWGEALRATSYEVTLWPAAQPKPVTPTAVVPLESYSPAAPLAYGTLYRWQVTTVNDFGKNTEAAIWEFTTESLINTPVPANGSANMLAWMPLQWAPAPGATAYDVYLWRNGETQPALPSGTVTTHQYLPDQTLDFGTTYHWQVVARLNGGGTASGPVWSFSTEAAGQSVTSPPFDISPGAQAARTLLYDTHGRDRLSSSDTPLTAGLTISFYGDSVTWQDAYLSRIRTALATSPNTSALGTTLINHGVNGGGVLTIRDGEPGQSTHFGGTAPQPFATTIANEHPDVVVLFVGINDIWWRETSEAAFEQSLRDIVAQAKAGGVSYFVMASPWLRYERPDGDNISDLEITAFSARCRKVVADTGATFVDLHTLAMAYLQNHNFTVATNGTLTYLDDGLLTYDGVHPSDTGNDFLADQLSLGILNAMADQPVMPVSLDLSAWPQATIRTQSSAGRVHVLEYSDNLSSWSAIETNIPLTGEVIFTDAGGVGRPAPGGVPTRYYRVLRKNF